MRYRIIVPSDRYADDTSDSLSKAYNICAELSIEFGYAEIKRNLCGPEPTLYSFQDGKATVH